MDALPKSNDSAVTDAEVLRLYRDNAEMKRALKTIVAWEMPPEIARGCMPSRQFIQNIAKTTLDRVLP